MNSSVSWAIDAYHMPDVWCHHAWPSHMPQPPILHLTQYGLWVTDDQLLSHRCTRQLFSATVTASISILILKVCSICSTLLTSDSITDISVISIKSSHFKSQLILSWRIFSFSKCALSNQKGSIPNISLSEVYTFTLSTWCGFGDEVSSG